MLSKLKQITTLKNKTFQSFEDVKQSKIQLEKNIQSLQDKINTATENYLILQTIENDLTNKIKEVTEFKTNNNLQKLQENFSQSMKEFNEITNNIQKIETSCFQKSKKLQELINSFLQ